MNASAYRNTTACSLCQDASSVLNSVIPAYYPVLNGPESLSPGLSCGDLAAIATERWSGNDTACDALRIAIAGECCDDGVFGGEIPTGGAAVVVPPYQCEQSVHSTLLGDGSGYSTTAAPLPGANIPLNVSVSIMYLHATEISTVAGTAELFFGFLMSWRDERLKWDPDAHGGCDQFVARASLDAEKTDLWVPDFDLQNRVSGVQNLPDASAAVFKNGTVEWWRLGGIKAVCLFDGLERFPYDELSCEFVFGPTMRRIPVNYIVNPDALFNAQTSIAKYQEFRIMPEKTTGTLGHALASTQTRLHFVFERASHYYTMAIVVPTILFTIVSFGIFLLDIRVGERLGFGVSLLLVIVANAILTQDMLPVCSERLWINLLTTSSYYWVMAALIESIFVACLFYLETEDMAVKDGRDEHHNDEGTSASSVPLAEHSPTGGHEINVIENGGDSQVERISVLKRQNPCLLALKRILVSRPRPSQTWRMNTIRRTDRVCVVIFPISYIVFFSVLIARNQYW